MTSRIRLAPLVAVLLVGCGSSDPDGVDCDGLDQTACINAGCQFEPVTARASVADGADTCTMEETEESICIVKVDEVANAFGTYTRERGGSTDVVVLNFTADFDGWTLCNGQAGPCQLCEYSP